MPSTSDTQRFSGLVGDIYDCVVEPSLWQSTLGKLTHEFEGVIATLAVLDISSRTTRFSAAYGDPNILEPLTTRYAAEMPFYATVPKADIDVPITIPQLCDLHGPDGREILHATRLWTEWFLPNRIADAFCTNIIKAENRVAALVINVDDSRRKIDAADIERLMLLTPHIRRAVTVGDLFDMERRHAEMLRDTLDSLKDSVLIVGSALDLYYANGAAEALLGESDTGLTVNRGKLTFKNVRGQNAFEKIVTLSAQNEAVLGTRGIGLPLPGPVPRIAHFLPLAQRRKRDPFGTKAAVAIFITEAHSATAPELETIAALFGLTAAERRVTGQVASGMNRSAIALANEVKDGTVKSHLDAIFDKTGTANQRELETLIRDLTPPIKHK